MPTTLTVNFVAMAVCYAHTQWLTNLSSLVVDVMPPRILATCFGVVAAGSAVGGIFMNKIVAAYISPQSFSMPSLFSGQAWADSALSWINAHRGYDTLFNAMACVHPIALPIIWGLRKRPST